MSGGRSNEANAIGSTIGGGGEDPNRPGAGRGNLITKGADFATISGGTRNRASGVQSTVGGGYTNRATGDNSTVGGGQENTASGLFSTVPGGHANIAAGEFSFAAGLRAKVNADHDGTTLFADSNNSDFNSEAANEFAARATGGVRFATDIDGDGNPTAGVQLAPGDSAWSALSDRNAKANFALADGRDIVERLSDIPIETWNYKSQDPSIRHIGPMAQDFYAAFGVGEDNRRINTVDSDGVALAAIQGLYEIVREKDTEIAALEVRIAALEEAKGVQTRLVPFNLSTVWMMAGGLGLLVVTPGLVLGYRRIRREE